MELKKEEEKVLLYKSVNNLINNPGLSQWEREFLLSINQQLAFRDLSEKQLNVLNNIKRKYRTVK